MKKKYKNGLMVVGIFLLGVTFSAAAKEQLVKLPVVGKYFI